MSMFDLQSSLLNQISSIISVLIEAGVDPNASCSPFGVGAKTSNLTALDAIFHILTDSNYGPVPKFRCDFLRLDCVLTKYGCETTGERAIRWPRMVSPYTLDIFIRSPEVAIGERRLSFPSALN